MKLIIVMVGFLPIFLGCGNQPQLASDTKIIGGRAARDYKFMSGITDGPDATRAFCGGTFIGTHLVVTAAHCLDETLNTLYVSVGLRRNSEHARANKIAVKAIRLHPKWNPSTLANDIALLFLHDYEPEQLPGALVPLTFNRDSSFPEEGQELTGIGWGNTTSYGWRLWDELQEVNLPLISVETCQKAYPDDDINKSQICAGDLLEGGRDSCQGDSGGPLIAETIDGPTLIGIVSWGQGCAQAAYPGVYTRLSYYSKWIDEEIEKYADASRLVERTKIGEYAQAYCYDKQGKLEIFKDNANVLNLATTFKPADEFSPSHIHPPNRTHLNMPPCHLTLPNGEALTLSIHSQEHLAEQKIYYKLDRPQVGETWITKAKAVKSFSLSCQDGAGELFFNYRPHKRNYIVYKGASYLLGSEYQGGLEQIEVVTSCELAETKLKFLRLPDQNSKVKYLASITNDAVLGGSKAYHLSQLTINEKLSIQLLSLSNTMGMFHIANSTAMDVHTWQLACPFEFELTDSAGNRYNAKRTSEKVNLFAMEFVKPELHSTIKSGESASFYYHSKENLAPGTSNLVCNINGIAHPVIIKVADKRGFSQPELKHHFSNSDET